ncbi:MAG: hypothetical protein M5U26_24025 [Planctomycetota bacterium]|nr:hypothetical protein [Planctomycetota bacterium]
MIQLEMDGQTGMAVLRLTIPEQLREGEDRDLRPLHFVYHNWSLVVNLIEAPGNKTHVESIGAFGVEDLSNLPRLLQDLDQIGFDFTDLETGGLEKLQRMCGAFAKLKLELGRS